MNNYLRQQILTKIAHIKDAISYHNKELTSLWKEKVELDNQLASLGDNQMDMFEEEGNPLYRSTGVNEMKYEAGD